ncbi:MAG: glycosyltransferase family 2 protein [Elusimicrobia bacterium]|nr:glycosyltransferase family 2 protein [Elusimicrobiota bacterium]
MTPRIAVVVPVFNEKGKIGRAVAKVPRDVVSEVVVVSDASDDGSDGEAAAAGATVLRHAHTLGVGAAIRTGLRYGLEKGYDVLVVMAGNDKDAPSEIPRLAAPILEGRADYVQGSRYAVGGRFGTMPLHRLLLTRAYPWLVRLVTGFPITDATNGFRALSPALLKDPRVNMDQGWLNRGELEYYLQLKALSLGWRVVEIPVSKIYPDLSAYRNYTKIKPVYDWLRNLRPILRLMLGSLD